MSEETLFSAVIVTYNEADLLPGCLESLAFCNELIVVDLGSTDESVAIAHSYGAKVLHHPKDPVVENVRAFGFEHTQHDWIVFLDPDERIHPELVPKIQKIIATNPKVGQIELPWQFYFKGKKLTVTRWGTEDKFKAIVIHKQRTYTRHIVHGGCRPKDGFELVRVEREGEIYITHYWMRGYRQFIQKHWMYIQKEGEARYVKKRRFSWQKTVQLTRTELIKNLTELGGLRGGWTGTFLSFFWGWYTFMSELSLRNYQKQVEDQPKKHQPEPQKTGLIQKISKWAKALKAYWKLSARRKPKNIPLKDQFGYLREYLGVADQLELRQQPDMLVMHPRLSERTATTSFDRHYFYQDTWAFRHIATQKPALHVDVGSRVIAVGFMSCVTAVEFIDIRPLKAELPNLTCKKGSVLDLPYTDQSLESISCLHVAEHVGLGRYGDPLNVIHGTRLACAELQRVLKPGGKLYFSLPISGENRIEFNAHRVHTVERILSYFPELKLVELSGVTDKGKYIENINQKLLNKQKYACGFFLFTREPAKEFLREEISHSQKGEDLALFEVLGKPANGFYVDVGSFHPSKFSNTRFFYDKGWHGINIEPMPHRYQLFEQERPRDINLNIGVGREAGQMIFYQMRPESLSTFSQEEAVRVSQLAEHELVREYSVEVLPLREIFKQYAFNTPIDFLCVDVEGTEIEVLESNDWELYRPQAVLLETLRYEPLGTENSLASRRTLRIFEEYMASKGYKLAYDNELNSIFFAARSFC